MVQEFADETSAVFDPNFAAKFSHHAIALVGNHQIS